MVILEEGEEASRNPQLSTGPRTAEGKERARMNAMTHSLTARIVLPWENEAEYDRRLERYKTGLPVRSELEEELAERAGQASWLMDRAMVAETARLTRLAEENPEAVAAREADEADALGNRLMFDPRGPAELYPSGEYMQGQPRTSRSEDPEDPHAPPGLVRNLKATRAGCRRLLREWSPMREMLIEGQNWQSEQKFRAVRLLGLQPLAAGSTRLVARIFLACHVIEPQFPYEFQELRARSTTSGSNNSKPVWTNRA